MTGNHELTVRPLSARNPRVQRLAKLAAKREERDRARALVVEGPTLVRAAVEAGAEVQEVYVDEGAAGRSAVRGALDALEASGSEAPVWALPDGVLARVGDAATSQGLTAIVGRATPEWPTPTQVPFAIVLVGLQIPGNVGTLLRAAAAAGAGAVVAVGGADPYGPKVVRSSAGAVFTMPVVRADDALDAIDRLRSDGYRTAAAVVRDGTSHLDADLGHPVALVLGSEAHGLPDEVVAACDLGVSIAMAGPTESLNVAMAGTVLAFEVLRQAGVPGAGTD